VAEDVSCGAVGVGQVRGGGVRRREVVCIVHGCDDYVFRVSRDVRWAGPSDADGCRGDDAESFDGRCVGCDARNGSGSSFGGSREPGEALVAFNQRLRDSLAWLPQPEVTAVPADPHQPRQTILDRVELSLALQRDEYKQQLDRLQQRLFHLEHELYVARVPAVIVYQGWDAAGKGGNIRRLTHGLDPRGYEVVPVGPPNAEEKARHYLWRFWRNVPKAGHITIFDRSWYGRVLVERIEGLCSEDEWQRAYREINEFERQLTDFGTVVVKFWLHIDQQEQLRRFEARQQTPHKQWKITEEDWRNRQKWDRYEAAVVDMLQRTSTTYGPWTILEANCKLYARIKALRTVADALQKAVASGP